MQKQMGGDNAESCQIKVSVEFIDNLKDENESGSSMLLD